MTRKPRTDGLAVGALLASGLLWGTTWMPLRHFHAAGLGGLSLTLVTYGVIGVAALPLLARSRGRWQPQWRWVGAAAIFGGLANACFVTALMAGSVTRAMLLFYLAPVWAVLGAGVVLRERPGPRSIVAILLALTGALLVLGGPSTLDAPPDTLDLLALVSGVFFAMQNVCARRADRVPVADKTLAAFAGCTVVAAVALPFSGQAYPPLPGTFAVQLALFAALWLVGAMWTQNYGVSHLPASRAAVFVIFELVAAVVTAALIGGERLAVAGWIGAALIVSATLVESRSSPASSDTFTRSPA
ncbi:MAG: EamA family transporter [Betaproteobacteria bacterium]|nr:EamA family transporter [Betaproteobacteria bacterium]